MRLSGKGGFILLLVDSLGIGLALLIECFRKPQGLIGLGLGGAVAINLCAGLVLAAWLIFGGLDLPLRGLVFLWILVFVLVGISTLELVAHLKSGKNARV